MIDKGRQFGEKTFTRRTFLAGLAGVGGVVALAGGAELFRADQEAQGWVDARLPQRPEREKRADEGVRGLAYYAMGAKLAEQNDVPGAVDIAKSPEVQGAVQRLQQDQATNKAREIMLYAQRKEHGTIPDATLGPGEKSWIGITLGGGSIIYSAFNWAKDRFRQTT